MKKIWVFLLFAEVVLIGCAFDLAHVSSAATQLSPASDVNKSFTLADTVQAKAPCGYDRTLRKDTTWDFVGTIPQGEVFKPKDQVLTVECSNVFEAYLVVSKGYLVGFYLPVEKGFVSASKAMELPIK